MKKLLTFAAGVLWLCSGYGMDQPFRRELDKHIDNLTLLIENHDMKKIGCFSISPPFKNALLEEVKEKARGHGMFMCFFRCEYLALSRLWKEYQTEADPEVWEKFKELMILIAPAVEVVRCLPEGERRKNLDWERKPEKFMENLSLITGDPQLVTRDIIKHPRFCFEMLFTMAVDARIIWSLVLYESFSCLCRDIYHSSDWPEKEKWNSLASGCLSLRTEDEGGNCHLRNVWPNWNKSEEGQESDEESVAEAPEAVGENLPDVTGEEK
jgi:hypothetical protein